MSTLFEVINIFISKLSNSYPVAEPTLWLSGEWHELDPIFAGRLAYFGKVNKVKIHITEGYRTNQRQADLYARYLRGDLKLAEKPGRSWHEFRIAVDTSTQPIRRMTSAQLNKYGLCKPIRSEGWHIQPIETQGQSDRKKFAPKWQEDDEVVTETQVIHNGEKKTLNRILKDGTNYIRLRDLEDVLGLCKVEYDEVQKLPIIK